MLLGLPGRQLYTPRSSLFQLECNSNTNALLPMDSATFGRSLQQIRVWQFCTITTPVQTCKQLRNIANTLFQSGKYADSQLTYAKAVKAIVNVEVPLSHEEEMRNETYMSMDWISRVELMACCVGMAKCLAKLDKLDKVSTNVFFEL
jgi:hypothetical protein